MNLFLIWLFKLAVVPLTMAQESNNLPLLIEVILELFENSTCPGIVLSLPDDDEARTERENVMLNELEINRFKRPVTWLTREWPKRREIVCNDAVILFRDQKTQLLSLYRQLRNCFYVNKVIVVINKRQTNSSSNSSSSLLEELKNERIFMLIESSNSLEISKWSVNQDRIHHHLLYGNNKSLSGADLSLKLSGRHLKVATLHHPPAVVIRPLNNSSEVGNCGSCGSVVEGIEPSIMKLIADGLNFTFDYVVAPANEMWGDVVTTATDQQQDRDHKQLTAAGNNQTSVVITRFTGIKGMLVRKEVDLAFGDMYMTPLWLSYISFSQIYKMDYDSFVVPSPKPLANWMALILPFSLKTWLATLASLVLVTAALAAKFIRNRSVIESSFLFALGQLLWIQQPRFPDGKSSTGSLFLIWSWLFAATILSSVYRSALISFLTHPYAQQPINSIQQLVESPLNKIMFSDFYKIILLNSTDPYRRQLGHQLKTTDNMSQMLDLLKTGKWAVDSSLDSLNYLMNDDDERGPTGPLGHRDLHIMQEKLFPTRSSFGLQKDSPLKSRVDLVLQRLIEGGLVDYHRSYLMNKPSSGRRFPSSGAMDEQRRRNNKKTTLIHFSLTNLQGAFYLLGIGVFVSTMAFALEFIISIFPSSSGRKTPSHIIKTNDIT